MEGVKLPYPAVVAVMIVLPLLVLFFNKVRTTTTTNNGIVVVPRWTIGKTTKKMVTDNNDGVDKKMRSPPPEEEEETKQQQQKQKTIADPVWDAPEVVQPLESESQWSILQARKETMLLQFTATTKLNHGSKSIAPLFEELCRQYAAHFIEVDVDAFGDLASSNQYKVSVLPTFAVVMFGGNNADQEEEVVVRSLTGGSHVALRKFCQTHLVPRNIHGKKHLY